MIFTLLLKLLVAFVNGAFYIFPHVTELPFGADTILQQGMGYINYISNIFPPIGILYSAFLVVMGFEASLFIIRFIPVVRHLVHRT